MFTCDICRSTVETRDRFRRGRDEAGSTQNAEATYHALKTVVRIRDKNSSWNPDKLQPKPSLSSSPLLNTGSFFISKHLTLFTIHIKKLAIMRFPLNILLLALHATSVVVASSNNINMTEMELLDHKFDDAIQGFANLSQDIGMLAEEFEKTMNVLNTMAMLFKLEALLEQQISNMSSANSGNGLMKGRDLKGNAGSGKTRAREAAKARRGDIKRKMRV
ncbi:hypothetical protein Clacol_004310 [Clathrus columnatus]|uniref:Uncharacterized protein n=1 Tax=Clathrus columnatus TaxID=1419009 RepID=A0AAV5AA34_9AGAM|nr:hypothetical protein Clacol_004310 [Clathrus columnatus]